MTPVCRAPRPSIVLAALALVACTSTEEPERDAPARLSVQQAAEPAVAPSPAPSPEREAAAQVAAEKVARRARAARRAPVAAARESSGVEDLLGALDGSGSNAAAPARAAAPSMAPARPLPPASIGAEQYDRTAESGFLPAASAPLSTFGIDVDTASYANARRFIEREDRLPPPDAVRVEEFVNYFDYDYPAPEEHPFAIHAEVSTAPWNPQHRLVHIGLQGREIDDAALPPQNLVFLIDVSGSMQASDKLPLLKHGFHMLVDTLRPHDRVAIVVYAGAAGLVLPSTSGKERDRIHGAIDGLRASGSTAGAAGIQLAYRVAADNFVDGGNNRVILATDGDFNVGVSSHRGLVELIEQKRETGVFLTVLGFGRGNYQDGKMELLSNKGNGTAAYIDSALEAKKVLVEGLGGMTTIAKDVKVQVEFNPHKVAAYRLVGYENRALADRDFADDRKDGGELGAGHTVTVLYEVVPVGMQVPGQPDLRYQPQRRNTRDPHPAELLTVKLRYKQPEGRRSRLVEQPLIDRHTAFADTSDAFRFSAAVAAFAQRLRGSQHIGDMTFEQVLAIARGAIGADPAGHRGGFVQLVRRASAIGAHARR